MKILITGAAGFMGSHLFDYLNKQEHEVIGIDNYSLGRYKHESIVELDLLNKEGVKHLVDNFKPDILFHLASWAHEGLSQFAPIRITENNYNAYLNVLVPCIDNGVKRVICCSSMSVYGDQTPPFNEDMERKPVDIYATAKTSMEKATEIMSGVFGFEYIIIRPHNVYGERQALWDPYRNVVAIFINSLLRDKPFYIYGDGKQTRAFSYIDDVTPYLARTAFIKQTNEIINIGPIEEYSINELANYVLKAFGSDLEPIYLPDRPTEVKHAFCTNNKATKLLGYKTNTTFQVGIKKMVKWAKEVGAVEPIYLDNLELEASNTPQTWKEKLI